MSATPLHMWPYFRGKYYTIAGCIDGAYSGTLGQDPEIKASLIQIKNAEAAIESRVAELAAKENTPEWDR